MFVSYSCYFIFVIPLQADLPRMSKTLPLVIFGVFGIVAGIMALWLPETRYSPMAQTVEQAEAWKEDYKIYCCKRYHAPKEDGSIGLMDREDGEEAEPSPILKEVPDHGSKYDTVV